MHRDLRETWDLGINEPITKSLEFTRIDRDGDHEGLAWASPNLHCWAFLPHKFQAHLMGIRQQALETSPQEELPLNLLWHIVHYDFGGWLVTENKDSTSSIRRHLFSIPDAYKRF